MLTRFIFTFFCLAMSLPLLGQYHYRFQQEYFFGNLPDPRSEAMGKASVAIGGSVASVFQNPASLATTGQQQVYVSTSAPFYILEESDYYFTGYSRRILPGIIAGISLNQLRIGPTGFETDINGKDFPLDKPVSSNLALTVAAEPLKGLTLGINANVFGLKYFDEVKPTRALNIDLGGLYVIHLSEHNKLQFGLGVTNILGSSIALISPEGDEASNNLPTVARIGAAYIINTEMDYPGAGSGPLQLTLTTEYQNVLNNDFRTTFRLGGEMVFWEFLAFRLGVFTQTLDDLGNSENRDQLNDITYGFGVIIPFEKLSGRNLPFIASLDYTSLESAPVVYSGTRLPNKRMFSLKIDWPLQTR